MTLMHVQVEPSPAMKLVVLFCVFWPFIALAFLRRGGRSSAPLTAMLIPIAVAACGMWLSIARVLEGMPITGGGHATAAGLAEALLVLAMGMLSAFAVALFALVKRHRPVANRGTFMVALLVMVHLVIALAVVLVTAVSPFREWSAPSRTAAFR